MDLSVDQMCPQRTSELEDIAVETFKTKQQKRKKSEKKAEENIQERFRLIVKGNIYVIRTSEGEGKKKRTEVFAS